MICVLAPPTQREHISAVPKPVFVVTLHVKRVVFHSWVRLYIMRG